MQDDSKTTLDKEAQSHSIIGGCSCVIIVPATYASARSIQTGASSLVFVYNGDKPSPEDIQQILQMMKEDKKQARDSEE